MTDITRSEMLRRQAEDQCARRTAERDDALAALCRQAYPSELGRALDGMTEQIRRLARTPGLPFSVTREGIIDHLRTEIDELERASSEADAVAEVGDIVALAVHLALAFGLSPIDVFDRQAAKIKGRLDRVDAGETWQASKVS